MKRSSLKKKKRNKNPGEKQERESMGALFKEEPTGDPVSIALIPDD